MKTLVIILTVASFLQSTFLPLNLVLIILIARALIRPQKTNLYLAFGGGLLISHLNLEPLGLQSLIYLILIQLTQVLTKSKVFANPLVIVPLTFILLSLNLLATSIITHQALYFLPNIFWESLIALPVFYLIRLWEERFIVSREIKLKV